MLSNSQTTANKQFSWESKHSRSSHLHVAGLASMYLSTSQHHISIVVVPCWWEWFMMYAEWRSYPVITADVDTNMNYVKHIKGRILLSKYLFMQLLDRQEERQTKQRYGNRDRDRYRQQEKKRDKENEDGKRRRTEEETDNRQPVDRDRV